jgi:CheY-like chemotaxis protein
MADLVLVDDDRDMSEVMSTVLELEGHTVRVAHDGQRGLDEIARRRPDLVLLDVEMPVLTGPETADRLFLRDCGDEKIPIVLLSGVLALSEVAALVGTPYFLGKPYSIEAVTMIVRRALAERTPPRPRLSAQPEV